MVFIYFFPPCRNGGKFKGMMRFDARVAIFKELDQLKLFKEKKDNAMSVPVCSRSGDIIEPYVKPQWYVKTAEMSKAAADVRGLFLFSNY